MLRIIALVLFVVVGAYGFEAFTGKDIGVGRALSSAAGGVTAALAGGYGLALGVGHSVFSAVGN